MAGKEVITNLQNDGITVAIENHKIRLFGCVTNEHRNLVKTHKDLVIAELAPEANHIEDIESLPDAQHIEALISNAYEPELAELIVWAWSNDNKWPITPFTLSDGCFIDSPRNFYLNELCPACLDQNNEKVKNGEVKAILLRLKKIVDSEFTNTDINQ